MTAVDSEKTWIKEIVKNGNWEILFSLKLIGLHNSTVHDICKFVILFLTFSVS